MSRAYCTKCDHCEYATKNRSKDSLYNIVLGVQLDLQKLGRKYYKNQDKITDFNLAVNEAIQNAIRHGKGKITICIGYVQSVRGFACAAITDEGAGIDQFNKEMPPIEALNGRGFPIMAQCANIECVKRPDKFTVYLTERLDNAATHNETNSDGVHWN